MSGEKKFELGDYVEVKDRIKLFYELFGNGRLVTGEVRLTTEPDGVPRVMVKGLAYRSPDDPLPGVGWSWLQLPGSTPYTRGSEIENAETSAWGRAIGSLGILIDRSIASSQEVQNKAGEADRPAAPSTPAAPEPYHEDEEIIGRERRRGIIRKAAKDAPDVYQLNVTPHPEGRTVGFRLETSKGNIPQCLVEGALGAALVAATGDKPADLVGIAATVAGILYHVKTNRGGSWYRLHVDRIETTINGLEVVLPADEDIPAPPDDVPLAGEKATAA